MLQINSEKMSKSLGNFTLLKDVLKRYPAPVIRLFMLQTHYRSPLDFSDARLDEASAAYERILTFIRNAHWAMNQPATGSLAQDGECISIVGGSDCIFNEIAPTPDRDVFAKVLDDVQDKFIADMDDDFNTAGALGAIFDIVKQGNGYLQAHEGALDSEDQLLLARTIEQVKGLLGALGVSIELPEEETDLDVEALLAQRQQARVEKDWERADQLRDQIDQMGYVIEDTAQGARVVRKG
jgi:cysteinyl-tRNA synthetase